MKIISIVLLIAMSFPAFAFELATTITQDGNTTKLETNAYAKVNLLQQAIFLQGSIVTTGTLNVKGAANIVMLSKVEGNYYFTKLPGLQNIRDTKDLNFKIPFNAADKTVTEVIIEVEMLSKGSVSLTGLSVEND